MDTTTIIMLIVCRAILYFVLSFNIQKVLDCGANHRTLFWITQIPLLGDMILLIGLAALTETLIKNSKMIKIQQIQQIEDNKHNHAKFYDPDYDFLAEAMEKGKIEHLDSFLATTSKRKAKAMREMSRIN